MYLLWFLFTITCNLTAQKWKKHGKICKKIYWKLYSSQFPYSRLCRKGYIWITAVGATLFCRVGYSRDGSNLVYLHQYLKGMPPFAAFCWFDPVLGCPPSDQHTREPYRTHCQLLQNGWSEQVFTPFISEDGSRKQWSRLEHEPSITAMVPWENLNRAKQMFSFNCLKSIEET